MGMMRRRLGSRRCVGWAERELIGGDGNPGRTTIARMGHFEMVNKLRRAAYSWHEKKLRLANECEQQAVQLRLGAYGGAPQGYRRRWKFFGNSLAGRPRQPIPKEQVPTSYLTLFTIAPLLFLGSAGHRSLNDTAAAPTKTLAFNRLNIHRTFRPHPHHIFRPVCCRGLDPGRFVLHGPLLA